MKIINRRILSALVLLVCCLALPAAAEVRIATIDLQKVYNNYWKKQQAEAALKESGAEMEKEFKSMVDDYNKAKETYAKLLAESTDQSLSAEERDKRKSAAETKLLELKNGESAIQTYRATANEQLDSKRVRMISTILQEIRAAVNAKAKSSGYNFVVDVSAESGAHAPVILYSSGENDMTDDILKQLNNSAPAGAATNAPASEPGKK